MTEQLTKETFLSKVFDYEKSQDWKFNGELPAIIDFWAPWCCALQNGRTGSGRII